LEGRREPLKNVPVVACDVLVNISLHDATDAVTQEEDSRLADIQRRFFPLECQQVSYSEVQPGDILYWPGHVAISLGNGMNVGAWTPGTPTVIRLF
jgi:ribosomal protein L16 Arg81 hydroxylase